MRAYALTAAIRPIAAAVTVLSTALPGAAQDAGGVELEYIAHACFRLHSPEGATVLIDPFASRVWLGYDFPADLAADAVLVTHPHYDHDAGEWIGRKPTWPEGTVVYREPGEYHVGDIYVRGIRGKHADPWGKEFGQRNTIWLIEVGGVVFVHLGDNGPLTEEIVDQLGQVDVLMTPLDGHDHILERSEVRAIRDVLQPSVVIPMHYRHPELEQPGGPKDLGELEPCLVDEPHVKRIAGNRVRLTREGLPEHETMFVFRPSPLVSPAPDAGSILHELCLNLRYLGQRRRDLRGERQQCAKLWKKGREAGWASEPTGVAEKVRALDWLRATAATPTPGKAARFELDIEEIARYALLALEVLPEEGAALRVRCGQLVRAVVRAQRVAWRVARNEAAYDDLGDGLADVVIESPAAGVEFWSGEVRGRVAAGETVEVILLSGRPQETVASAEVENNTFIVQLAPERGTWQGVAVLGKDGRGRVVSVSPVVWVRGRR